MCFWRSWSIHTPMIETRVPWGHMVLNFISITAYIFRQNQTNSPYYSLSVVIHLNIYTSNGCDARTSFKDSSVFILAWHHMMTSSNGNIFRVTGPLCGEFTGPGEFPAQRPVTRSFDVFFHLRLNKRLSKQPRGWWFKTPSWSLWRQCNELGILC